MTKIEIEIDTDNAAFVGDPTPETVRILRDLIDKIESGSAASREPGHLRDVNGNRVGSYLVTAD